MSHLRAALFPALLLASWSAASGQSVTSTHSGLLYFFEGNVYVGDEQLQQKFGRFPEIGQGVVLRTERGRAEVLLTPGVFLRIDENSSVRIVSNRLSDTRIELLSGSAIIEANHEATNPPDEVIYKSWKVRLPGDSVVRIDSVPAQVRVHSGTAEVSKEGASDRVTVQRGQVLPLASVLVADPAPTAAADNFNVWAMNRSSVVSEDNTVAAGITDDPDQIDTSGIALGGFTYFPQTGIPSLGISYPYGLSFWNPYQSWLSSPWLNTTWFGPGLPYYPYGLLYRRMPSSTLFYPRPGYPQPIGIVPGGGVSGRGLNFPRPPLTPLPRPAVTAPHITAPRPVIHR